MDAKHLARAIEIYKAYRSKFKTMEAVNKTKNVLLSHGLHAERAQEYAFAARDAAERTPVDTGSA